MTEWRPSECLYSGPRGSIRSNTRLSTQAQSAPSLPSYRRPPADPPLSRHFARFSRPFSKFEQQQAAGPASAVAPHDEYEEAVLQIFREVLGGDGEDEDEDDAMDDSEEVRLAFLS
jgi:predicted component of type VI protein secretion system